MSSAEAISTRSARKHKASRSDDLLTRPQLQLSPLARDGRSSQPPIVPRLQGQDFGKGVVPSCATFEGKLSSGFVAQIF